MSCDGMWNLTLTHDSGQVERCSVSVVHNPAGSEHLIGAVLDAVGHPIPNTLRNGLCHVGAGTGGTIMRFIIKLGTRELFVSGVTSGIQYDSTFVAFDDPGDTGTGSGQQGTLLEAQAAEAARVRRLFNLEEPPSEG